MEGNRIENKIITVPYVYGSQTKVNDMEPDTLMRISFKLLYNSRMEILLNTQDYNCYSFDMFSVTPQNFIKIFYQKAEVLKIL